MGENVDHLFFLFPFTLYTTPPPRPFPGQVEEEYSKETVFWSLNFPLLPHIEIFPSLSIVNVKSIFGANSI